MLKTELVKSIIASIMEKKIRKEFDVDADISLKDFEISHDGSGITGRLSVSVNMASEDARKLLQRFIA